MPAKIAIVQALAIYPALTVLVFLRRKVEALRTRLRGLIQRAGSTHRQGRPALA